jgi:hypothetical protein
VFIRWSPLRSDFYATKSAGRKRKRSETVTQIHEFPWYYPTRRMAGDGVAWSPSCASRRELSTSLAMPLRQGAITWQLMYIKVSAGPSADDRTDKEEPFILQEESI